MPSAPRGAAGGRAAAPALPAPAALGRLVGAIAPTRASIAAGLVVALVSAAAYGAARQTSAFAVQDVVVRGASPALAAEVSRALSPVHGSSLLTLDRSDVVPRALSVPRVAHAAYDRAFPGTLVVTVTPERAVAVVRQGAAAWLVSARGRVLERRARGHRTAAPRVWVRKTVPLSLGERVGDAQARRAVAAAAAVRPGLLPAAVKTVTAERGALSFQLSSGLELRLGDGRALALKLAVAAELLPTLPPPAAGGPRYVDLLVPSRPVVGPFGRASNNPQPEG